MPIGKGTTGGAAAIPGSNVKIADEVMLKTNGNKTDGRTNGKKAGLAELDPSKLIVNLTKSPRTLTDSLESLGFGETKSNHMLICTYDPQSGWAPPEIKPYGPLNIDPAASCLQYATTVFEGMKAYAGPNGEIRLFRPEMNIQRLTRSAARVSLPPFDQNALLLLVKKLVELEQEWVPKEYGYSMYLRPTMIGTRSAFGVTPSDSAILYVVCAPAGPYFRPKPRASPALPSVVSASTISPSISNTPITNTLNSFSRTRVITQHIFTSGPQRISLLAEKNYVRAWPGGTGGHKLASNYCPGFVPQIEAAKKGFDQILWLFNTDNDDYDDENDEEDEEKGDVKPRKRGMKVTEAGAMNFFLVVRSETQASDGVVNVEVITPPLDGTILPGVTRDSVISLLRSHPSSPSGGESQSRLPFVPDNYRIKVCVDKTLTIEDILEWDSHGRLLEAFAVGTGVVVAPVGRIGYEVEVEVSGSTKPKRTTRKGKKRETQLRVVHFPEYDAEGRTVQVGDVQVQVEVDADSVVGDVSNGSLTREVETELAPVTRGVKERLLQIQYGRFEWKSWSVPL